MSVGYPVGYLIKNISDKMKANADANLKEHNLTLTQSRVMGFLSSRGNSASQKEIEDFLEVSHPTVVGVVARMELKGFITTRVDMSDKRNKIVELSGKAIQLGSEMDSMVETYERQMTRGLSEMQLKQLSEYLQVIYVNLGGDAK
jgi:DNA-binding MarR family transcriptional regulator